MFYPTGRPSTLALTREIAALGYEVSGFPLRNTNLRLLIAPGVWHWTVVIGDIILFIVVPVESTDSASDQSGYETKDSPFYDSDNVDPDYPGGGMVTGGKGNSEIGSWRSSRCSADAKVHKAEPLGARLKLTSIRRSLSVLG